MSNDFDFANTGSSGVNLGQIGKHAEQAVDKHVSRHWVLIAAFITIFGGVLFGLYDHHGRLCRMEAFQEVLLKTRDK